MFDKLPNEEFRKLVRFLKDIREKKAEKFYDDREPREVQWAAYTEAQIADVPELLRFIRIAVERCVNPPRKVGKPLTDPKTLVKAILLCEAFNLPERKAQGFLAVFGTAAGIAEKLDDRVIGKAYDKQEVAFLLRQVFEQCKTSDGVLSGDGTGLETSRRQNYCKDKTSTKEFLTAITLADAFVPAES